MVLLNASGNLDSRRRGYILVVILGFAAVVTSLGLAFLNSHSTAMPEAVNAYGAVRAQYVAESGVAIANHFLMYPPTTVTGCGYWTGANNIAVDATNDYTNVTVVQDAGNIDTFTITAVGVALNPDGTVRGKRTITAKVVRPRGSMARIPYAILADAQVCGGSTFGIPYTNTPMRFYGDIHAQGGSLWSCGWCQGNVSATTSVCWSSCGGTGPPSSITENAASFTLPPISPMNYQNYTVNGAAYSALAPSGSDWNAGDAAVITMWLDFSAASNPGRVVYRAGNLKLRDNFVLNGTLAVQGNLTIEGSGVQIVAVQNYPALVVSGNVLFGANSKNAALTGPVLIGGQLQDNNKSSVGFSVTGACVVKRGFLLQRTDGAYVFTWDCNRSMFWDFCLAAGGEAPITILSWREN